MLLTESLILEVAINFLSMNEVTTRLELFIHLGFVQERSLLFNSPFIDQCPFWVFLFSSPSGFTLHSFPFYSKFKKFFLGKFSFLNELLTVVKIDSNVMVWTILMLCLLIIEKFMVKLLNYL